MYECSGSKCRAKLTPEKLSGVDLDDDEINTLLLGIKDIGPLGPFDEVRPAPIDIGPTIVACPSCRGGTVEINVRVKASVCTDCFEHIELLKVLPSDAQLDTSLSQVYTRYECSDCSDCSAKLTPEGLSDVDLDEDEINTLLQDIKDIGRRGPFGRVHLIPVDIGPTSVTCPFCHDGTVDINVRVRATMVNMEVFEDIELLEVLPSNALLDGSLSNCLQWFDDYESEYDYLPSLLQHDLVQDCLKLTIIAKTRMNNGFCYIGLDADTSKLVRPILRTKTKQCCWLPTDPSFEVGEGHTFQVSIHNPPDIPNPHKVNDVQVEHRNKVFGEGRVANLFNILAPLSHDRVEDIFGGAKQYVLEEASCPSVGIYRCKGKHLKLYTSRYNKSRCRIQQFGASNEGAVGGPSSWFEFPETFLQVYGENQGGEVDVLVILGLGRPFAGDRNFDPKRCYILVIGIINHKPLDG